MSAKLKLPKASAAAFFAYARERQNILLRRRSGEAWPWTKDAVLQQYYFCNVFREDDRTTIWFRENVRDKLRDQPAVLLATAAFRWFNRAETGKVLLPVLLGRWSSKKAKKLLAAAKLDRYVTGAYMIRSKEGMPKHESILQQIDGFAASVDVAEIEGCSLEEAHRRLGAVDYLGGFLAYELVTDLRWTYLLEGAEDKDSWCFVGPGAVRGAGRILSGNERLFSRHSRLGQQAAMEVACRLLEMSRMRKHWPWPSRWELRDVEHTLCEFDKYERARKVGSNMRMKRRYRPGGHGDAL